MAFKFGLIWENAFIRESEKAKKRGKNMDKLSTVIGMLLAGEPLPRKNRNHKLQGEFKGCWECHIEPDWLLIYKKTGTDIILLRLGTHADLFE